MSSHRAEYLWFLRNLVAVVKNYRSVISMAKRAVVGFYWSRFCSFSCTGIVVPACEPILALLSKFVAKQMR